MRKAITIAGVALSVGLLAVILWRADWREVRVQVQRFGWRTWFLGALVYLLAFIPRGWRWRLMLPKSTNLPAAEVTKLVVIGYTANNVLPFRLGELVRSVAAGTRFQISKTTCLGTIAAEKILDGCCLLALLAASLPFITIRDEYQATFCRLAWVVAGLFGASLASCFALARWHAPLLIWSRRRLPAKLTRLFETAMAALATFRSARTTAATAALTVLVWTLEGCCFALFLQRMEVDAVLPKAFFCLVVVNMGILIPSAPGYVGVFQAGAVAALLALGMDPSRGLALGIVVHAAQWIPTTILGVIFMAMMGLSWRRFYHLVDE